MQCSRVTHKKTKSISRSIQLRITQAITAMNLCESADGFKVLAISILEDQNSQRVMACQDGSTLFKIFIKGIDIEIPFRTIFFASGHKTGFEEDMTFITVNLDNPTHRFIAFSELKPSDDPNANIVPFLSDQKPPLLHNDLMKFNFTLIQKQSNCLRLIKDELMRKDFITGIVPDFIKGSAYLFMFNDLIVS